MVAQQEQTLYGVCLHATAGSAPGHTHPCCAFGALSVPMAMPGSPGALPQSLSLLCLPTSGHGGARLLREVPAPVCSMPVYPEPRQSQGLPTHYKVCCAPTGAEWLTVCDKVPKEDFDGLCKLWFLHACTE